MGDAAGGGVGVGTAGNGTTGAAAEILNRRVEGFLEVVRRGSISRAASVLGMSQPALSQAMQSLEASTGLQLLHRTGRGVELTDAGRLVFEAAQTAERDIRRALDLAARQQNTLVVGTNCRTCGVICTEVGRIFRANHPECQLTLRDLPGNDTLAEGIAAGCELVEAAFSDAFPDSRRYPAGTVFHRMLDAEIVLCVPPEDSLASLDRPLDLADLDGRTICLYRRGVLDSNDRLIDLIEASGKDICLKFSDDGEYSNIDFLVNGWLSPSLSIIAERKHPMVPLRFAGTPTMTIGLFGIGELSTAARLFLEEATALFGGEKRAMTGERGGA